MPPITKTDEDVAFAKALGKALKLLRKQHDIKATHLAEKIGSLQQTISLWEQGTHLPSFQALRRIALATDTPMWKIVRAAEQLQRVAAARESQKEGTSSGADGI